MHRYQGKATQILKNQANMTPPKETNKAPVTNFPKWRSTVDIENSFDKIQHTFTIKPLNKFDIEGTFFNIIKAICDNPH